VALSFFALQVDFLPDSFQNWGGENSGEFAAIRRDRIGAAAADWLEAADLGNADHHGDAGFFFAVVRSYAMGLQINCGCFATEPESLTIKTVLRDGALAALRC